MNQDLIQLREEWAASLEKAKKSSEGVREKEKEDIILKERYNQVKKIKAESTTKIIIKDSKIQIVPIIKGGIAHESI